MPDATILPFPSTRRERLKRIIDRMDADDLDTIARILPFPATPQVQPIPAEPSERLTPDQIVRLGKAIDLALGFLFAMGSQQDKGWAWNRLRVKLGVRFLHDIRQDQFEAALEEIGRIQADCKAVASAWDELRVYLVREVVGAGTPWTPTLAKRWRARFREALPERPDWLAIAAQYPW